MKPTLLFATVAALAIGAVSAQAQAPAGYKVVKEVPLGSPERWDYVVYDAPSHRVYVAHSDRISVVDAQEGKLIGEVTGVSGTHGVGIANGKGYTDDGEAGQAIVFDPKTLKVIKRIPAKKDADGVTVDSKSGHVFFVDGDSATVTVIDSKTDAVLANIDAGGGLEYAVPGDDGKVYVNGAEKKEIVRIDVKTNAIDARWPIPGCTSPHGLAIDTAGHRLFVTCVNKVMTVVDTTSGAVVATLPIGQGTDAAAFDPKRKRAFSSNGEGTLTVVAETSPGSFSVTETVPTRVTGRTMGIDPASGRLFIAAADIDPKAPVPAGPNGRPGRPQPVKGSLKLLFLDPVR
ncbi:MAG: YncE family protein [Caulobacteraceae bacterium]